jgi:nickel superoxide dismutase
MWLFQYLLSREENKMRNLFAEFTPVTVHAHCDVPCGIYDPSGAVIAAKTVARMVELIGQIEVTDSATRNKLVRCITTKEEHAEKVKHEVQVIWSDYFKPEHLAKFPDLHDQVWKLLKLASKNKQNVDAAAAAELVAATEAFAATFVASKA